MKEQLLSFAVQTVQNSQVVEQRKLMRKYFKQETVYQVS